MTAASRRAAEPAASGVLRGPTAHAGYEEKGSRMARAGALHRQRSRLHVEFVFI